ncbi:protein kinase [Thermococcus sp. 18S1]|uniref:serine/threonine-protein kinase n=1 Tax=Thermococcus sp. 18S1 TaxID=1638210 RepID=UPI003211E2C8
MGILIILWLIIGGMLLSAPIGFAKETRPMGSIIWKADLQSVLEGSAHDYKLKVFGNDKYIVLVADNKLLVFNSTHGLLWVKTHDCGEDLNTVFVDGTEDGRVVLTCGPQKTYLYDPQGNIIARFNFGGSVSVGGNVIYIASLSDDVVYRVSFDGKILSTIPIKGSLSYYGISVLSLKTGVVGFLIRVSDEKHEFLTFFDDLTKRSSISFDIGQDSFIVDASFKYGDFLAASASAYEKHGTIYYDGRKVELNDRILQVDEDYKYIVALGEKKIYVFDKKTLEQIFSYSLPETEAILKPYYGSYEEKNIALVNNYLILTYDWKIYIFDINSKKLVAKYAIGGYRGTVAGGYDIAAVFNSAELYVIIPWAKDYVELYKDGSLAGIKYRTPDYMQEILAEYVIGNISLGKQGLWHEGFNLTGADWNGWDETSKAISELSSKNYDEALATALLMHDRAREIFDNYLETLKIWKEMCSVASKYREVKFPEGGCSHKIWTKLQELFNNGNYEEARGYIWTYYRYTINATIRKYNNAKEEIQKANDAIQKYKSKFDMSKAEAFLAKANEQFSQGEYDKAYEFAEKAYSYAIDVDQDGSSNDKDFAPTVNNMFIYGAIVGAVLVGGFTYQTSKKKAERKRKIEKINSILNELTALSPVRAYPKLQEALQIAKEISDENLQRNIKSKLRDTEEKIKQKIASRKQNAQIFEENEEYDKALKEYKAILELSRILGTETAEIKKKIEEIEIKLKKEEAKHQINQHITEGTRYLKQGSYDNAFRKYLQALTLAKENGLPIKEREIISLISKLQLEVEDLAKDLVAKKDYLGALSSLKLALEIRKQLGLDTQDIERKIEGVKELIKEHKTKISPKSATTFQPKPKHIPYFPPELLNKYESLEFLGEGGFAKVFKVRRKKDGKIIALKVSRLDEKAKKFFLKEVRAWRLLDHPNIVKLYNAFDEPLPHLEIEFVDGIQLDGEVIRDLGKYLKPVDEETALALVRGIAEGLKHAHSKQVYHRDLKPQNVLITSSLTPKITDWGLAKVGAVSTTATTTKGLTLLYAAPEQLDDETYGHTDQRTDIYQLGLIFYELLTGKLPYQGTSPAVVMAKVINPAVKPKPPSHFNKALAKYDGIFEKLLAKRKEDRYQSVEEFLHDLKLMKKLDEERKALEKEIEKTKTTMSMTTDSKEFKKLMRQLVGQLSRNALLHAQLNDKAGLINALEDLKAFTKEHRDEIENAINQFELMMRESVPISKSTLDELKVLLHKVQKEVEK